MMYLASIFLFGTLGFTQVGHTNFDLSSSYQVAAGPSASINLGGGLEYAVQIPLGAHTVTSSDVGRILALHSTANPRHNSGLFRVQTVDSGTNRLFVNYASQDVPPAESATLDFKLFLSESNFVPVNAGNALGASAYHGWGSANNTRIILRSPHSSSWQVRLCYETPADANAIGFIVTATPGMSGNSAGDFATGSYDINNRVEHLHAPLWHNLTNFNLTRGSAPGLSGPSGVDNLAFMRFFAWGDDQTGTTILVNRNISSSYVDGWNSFGMVDDVDYELPPRTINRLFTMGTVFVTNLMEVSWLSGLLDDNVQQGVAFGLNNKPVSCCFAQYCYMGGQTYIPSLNRQGIKGELVATDNLLLSASELQSVELVAGTLESNYLISQNTMNYALFEFDPRIMGKFPMARLGRSNFASWSTTSDASRSWFHIHSGVYLPWSGPSV